MVPLEHRIWTHIYWHARCGELTMQFKKEIACTLPCGFYLKMSSPAAWVAATLCTLFYATFRIRAQFSSR
jgi:hypothetical protein